MWSNMRGSLLDFVAGSRETLSVEQRLFNTLTATILTIGILIVPISGFFSPNPLLVILAIIPLSIVGTAYAASRLKGISRPFTFPVLMSLYLSAIVVWVTAGGLEGSGPIYAIVLLCVTIVVYPKSPPLLTLLLFLLTYCGLIGAEQFYPEAFTGHNHPTQRLVSVGSALFIGLILLSIMLHAIITAYADEENLTTRLLEDLRSSEGSLHKANTFKKELIGMAAHDIKNPLTGILLSAELLEMPTLSDDQRAQLASSVTEETKRVLSIVERILDSEAAESGEISISNQRVVMPELLYAAARRWRASASEKEVFVEVSSVIGREITTDPRLVQQILDNLLSNAIKFCSPGDMVHLKCWTTEDETSLVVIDNGPGMTQEDQSRLFRAYTQGENKPTAGEHSSGLGLNIVQRLTHALGGTVKVDSVLDEGTTFEVCLPNTPKA